MDIDFKKELNFFKNTFEYDEVVINKLLVLNFHQILLFFKKRINTQKNSHFLHFLKTLIIGF
jgi:hypothetical protein